MKPFLFTLALLACLTAACRAQSLPKTTDINENIASDGSIDLGFQMTFDAAPWRQWKAMVGDDPARLRAMMRHQFAAYTLENFKLERDDLNREAKLSMHSPTGPELRDDGTYQIPVEGYFRLVNGEGRSWYFSGNNPYAGESLNNCKITLPANAANASVVNPNSKDQALIFGLTSPPSPWRWFYVAGSLASLVGVLTLLAGLLSTAQRFEVLPPPAPRTLPNPPPVITEPPSSALGGASPPPLSQPAAEQVREIPR